MIVTIEDFRQISSPRFCELVQKTGSKVITNSVTLAGVEVFLQNHNPRTEADFLSGVNYIGFVFQQQLGGLKIKENDILRDEETGIDYEVVEDPNSKDYNRDYEGFYRLKLKRRYAS
jgi:hypothetical protein